MDELLTTKQNVIGLMRQIFGRLREHGIYLADVIDALRVHGVDITRTRFDDLFMTRPEREVNISVGLFTCTTKFNVGFVNDIVLKSIVLKKTENVLDRTYFL